MHFLRSITYGVVGCLACLAVCALAIIAAAIIVVAVIALLYIANVDNLLKSDGFDDYTVARILGVLIPPAGVGLALVEANT